MAPPAMAKSGKSTDPMTEPPSTGVRRTAPTTTRTPPAVARPTKHHRTRVTETPRWRATAALTPGVQPRPLDLTRGGRGGRGARAGVADPPAAPAAPVAPAGADAPSDAPVGGVTWSAAGSWGVGTPPS